MVSTIQDCGNMSVFKSNSARHCWASVLRYRTVWLEHGNDGYEQ
jgi:hypothetical protein